MAHQLMWDTAVCIRQGSRYVASTVYVTADGFKNVNGSEESVGLYFLAASEG